MSNSITKPSKDSNPLNFSLQTLKNLPQFRDKSHEELRQYILETKGVDIGGNFNWNGFAIIILIVIAVVIGGMVFGSGIIAEKTKTISQNRFNPSDFLFRNIGFCF